MFEDVDEEPEIITNGNRNSQQSKSIQSIHNKVPHNQYNPLNFEISPTEFNPWNDPCLKIYCEHSSFSETLFSENSNIQLPLYIRPVSTFFPVSKALYDSLHIPLGLIINPALMDQNHIPVTNLSNSQLIRCPRCSAHINPYCEISSDGRRWKCSLCGNDTVFLTGNVRKNPEKISTPFSNQNQSITGFYSLTKQDGHDITFSHDDRIEITSPVVDIIPPSNYSPKQNAGPSFLFIIDTSRSSYSHGYAQSVASSIISSIDAFSPKTYISLITIDSGITIYDFKKGNSTVYSDLDPEILSQELVSNVYTIDEHNWQVKHRFLSILKEIQHKSVVKEESNTPIGNCLGSALELVPRILNEIGGVVLAFPFGPARIGPRSISKRSDNEIGNERQLLKMTKTENSVFYATMGGIFAKSSISLHLFSASSQKPNDFVDLAVMAVPSGLSGGKCYFYKDFNPLLHSSELHRDIYTTLTTKYLWNATLRLRIKNGVSIRRIYVNSKITENDTVSLPAMIPDDSITYEFFIEPHITTDNIVLQLSLAWNNDERQRMMRIFTFSLPVTEDPTIVLKNVDAGALTALLTKRAIPKILTDGPDCGAKFFVQETKEIINTICVPSSTRDSNAPKVPLRSFINFQSFPQLTFGILQSSFLMTPFPTGPDGRFAEILNMRSIGIIDLLLFSYPRVMTIDLELLTLSKSSLNKYLNNILIIHSYNFVYIWSLAKETLLNELGNQAARNGLVDVDKIDNEQLKMSVKSCWALSRKFLITIAIFGEDALNVFLVENAITSNFNYASWLEPFRPAL